MKKSIQKNQSEIQRRQFMKWVSLSSLSLAIPFHGCISETNKNTDFYTSDLRNISDLETKSKEIMERSALSYLNGGAEDLRTVYANTEAYKNIEIRARRLIDVRNISTNVEFLGQKLDNPIILSPIGFQKLFHKQGEIASAKAAFIRKSPMIVSSVSNYSINEIASASNANLWFQLYPTPNREVTKKLLKKVENSGCKILVLTVDSPVIGNRNRMTPNSTKLSKRIVRKLNNQDLSMGNFKDILSPGTNKLDPGMTWKMIDWLKKHTHMKIVLKGIVTHEDAILAVNNGADGIIVSNHGGRQLDSNRATIDCLEEVVKVVDGKIPVLIDGGIRRGTDIFKALALGATAICIGRPYCWGLGLLGQEGVEIALDILKTELMRDMQLAGTTSIENISRNHILVN